MIRRIIVCAFAAVLALAVGPASHAQTQGTNSSSTATAESGDSNADNTASANAGPSSNGGTSQQIGDNNVVIRQHSESHSGDAVAGSQVFGVVGGSPTIQGTNNSTGAVAVSGASNASNSATVNAGPSSSGGGTATAQQTGDNAVVLYQTSISTTGDAVAGAQIAGAVASCGCGDPVIQLTNNSTDAFALSGAAFATNTASINAGPSAGGTTGTASANQIGDNTVVLDQHAEATSGDAVAGSIVVGSVGGSSTIQTTNNSDGAIAVSGAAFATNTASINAGPSAGGTTTATAQQIGDNHMDFWQHAEATSGDAVAGSTVIGAVGDGGTIQSTNNSDGAVTASGPATAFNDLSANAGPSAGFTTGTANANQIGDNTQVGDQWASAASGDAVAGSGIFGAVGGDYTIQTTNNSDDSFAISGAAVAANTAIIDAGPWAGGTGTATAQQVGDNDIGFWQHAEATSGDAVAGSTVIGAVGDGGTIQSTNNSSGDTATSASATAANVAGGAIGPSSNNGTAQHDGNNGLVIDQALATSSGDAVSGSQVVGSA